MKEWISCKNCRLEPEVSFQQGMTFVPASVEFVKITGQIMCDAEIREWMKFFALNVIGFLRRKGVDLEVDLRDLKIVNV